MSKLKIIANWFPSNSGLFAFLNSALLLLTFYFIKINDIEISLSLIVILIAMNLAYGLINHETLIQESN